MGRAQGTIEKAAPRLPGRYGRRATTGILDCSYDVRSPAPAAQTIAALRSLDAGEYATLLQTVRPRGASTVGFLRRDEDLLAVLTADVAALAEVGLTPQRLAARLQEVLYPYVDYNLASPLRYTLREKMGIPEHLEVGFFAPFRGGQSCPFAQCKDGVGCGTGLVVHDVTFAFGEANFTIRNKRKHLTVRGGGLLPHLAAEHSFFEGFRAKYRTDPILLARVLDLID